MLVEALDRSDDPLVENEMRFSYRALAFKDRPSPAVSPESTNQKETQ